MVKKKNVAPFLYILFTICIISPKLNHSFAEYISCKNVHFTSTSLKIILKTPDIQLLLRNTEINISKYKTKSCI